MTATKSNIIEYVILVDDQDNEIGMEEKLKAHQLNLLHRAFSVFIFTKKGDGYEVLLQQRAAHKYHSPNLWTNACCSHPRSGESILAAAHRRLAEELNLSAPLEALSWFKYNAHFPNGLAEHEIDHVLVGEIAADTVVHLNPDEAKAMRWIDLTSLRLEIKNAPHLFTPWLTQALDVLQKDAPHFFNNH